MEITFSTTVDESGKVSISFGNAGNIKTDRKHKGKSLLSFPDEYVVVDIETTGLSPRYDEIIEIAAIKYSNGQEIDSYNTLVKPEYEIDEYITELTGITNEMLTNAPRIDDVIGSFGDFIGEEIIVGHNVNFDINFLYDNMISCNGNPLKNDFVDTMRISRKVLGDLPHHRLSDIANYYDVSYEGAHRSKADCEICNAVFMALKNDVETNEIILETKKNSRSHKGISAKEISTGNTMFDEGHPLYGKVCVFTGALERMQRKEAMQLVADFGGVPADGVTKKTNYLILGNNDYCKSIKDGKSSKQKKAEKLILEGADLQIMPEQVFYDLVLENHNM